MYMRAQSTHKLPVHSAKGFANFSASLAMLPPTCPLRMEGNYTIFSVAALPDCFKGAVLYTEVKIKQPGGQQAQQETSAKKKFDPKR
jgi:hypothetical protein